VQSHLHDHREWLQKPARDWRVARVPGQPALSLPKGLVQYWHLLSLDAPTVAALWAWSFARVVHAALTPDSLLLLFLGTWLIYVADRILDGFHPESGQDSARLRERHFFYMRHRAAAIGVAIPVAAFTAWLVFAQIAPAARLADILISTVAIAYFSLVHLRVPAIERWFPKELIVALVFAAATAVPAWARLSQEPAATLAQSQAGLALTAVLFAALCWLNCIAIEKWEQTPQRARPAHSTPSHNSQAQISGTTRWGQAHLRPLSAVIAAAALFAAALFLHSGLIPSAELCFAAAFSAALFNALDRSPLSAFHLRIAADAALLTPLLVLFFR